MSLFEKITRYWFYSSSIWQMIGNFHISESESCSLLGSITIIMPDNLINSSGGSSGTKFSAASTSSVDVGWTLLFSMNWRKESMQFALDSNWKYPAVGMLMIAFRKNFWSPNSVKSSLTKSNEQLFKWLLVATCCVDDTEFLRFGDEKSRRLFLIIRSTIMLTILLLLLAMGEAIEKQAVFLSSAVILDLVQMETVSDSIYIPFFCRLVKEKLNFFQK